MRVIKDRNRSKEAPSSGSDLKLAPAVPHGSESLESLGSWVDNLFGDGRDREAAARLAAAREKPFAQRQADSDTSSEPQPESPPAEPPPAVPAGNEPITKGDDPSTERR